jgi:hypothetical protein
MEWRQGRHTLSNPRKIDKSVDVRIATRKEFLDKIKDALSLVVLD